MRLAPALALLAFAACGTKPPSSPTTPNNGVPAFRGLLATPRQLAFTCVVPGCDTTLTVKVRSNVNRRVAIKRIVLSKENAEYTITTTERAPFILGAASDFDIDVRFAAASAPTSEALDLLVTYTDASAEESPDRIEPGELKIPLVKRLVGEPVLAANPGSLNFGVVPVTQRKELPVNVANEGFGNIALEVDRTDSGVPELSVGLASPVALVPDASVPLPFVFAPTTEAYLKTEVEIGSSTPGVDPVYVTVEGTSHTWPRVALEPEETALDFGEIPKGQREKVKVKLANVGGRALNITSVSAMDPSSRVTVTFPGGMTSATLDPLQRLELEVEVNGTTPGFIDVPLRVLSNDPVRGQLEIPIRATITEPKIQANPTSLDWMVVPQGWVMSKPVELKNVGYGALTIKRITFVGGTSQLFALKNLPPVPVQLARNERVAFEVEFRAQSAASFSGAVSIETDDPLNPFAEVALAATGGTCAQGCPIANGTPSCNMGTCGVGSCNTGWHDTDLEASNGCECREIGTDPAGFCTTGVDKGTLADNGSSANHTGIIHSTDDEDYIRFFARDDGQVFGDNFDVQITLTSADPNISMCVSRYDTANSVSECYVDSNKVCGVRSVSRGGAYGREDGAMFYIKVYRNPAAPATCTSYTLYMRNG
ncbi:MAG: choice-of-anchor D domain-containing protein [Myxococcota bacterium]